MISKDPTNISSVLPDALITALVEAIPLVTATERTDRVRSRLFARIHAQPLPVGVPSTSLSKSSATPSVSMVAPMSINPFITLSSHTGTDGWVEMLPKAHAKLLFSDGQAEAYMIQLEPGAWAPGHEHPADEECLVLEGSLWQGDIFLRAGDYHVARPGMKHGDLRTDTGALVYIRYGKPLSEYLKM